MSMISTVLNRPPRPTSAAGFTLVEVLVALFILAVGLLGLAMLQTTGLRFNTNSYTRTQATYLASDIVERMRANLTAFTAGNYDITTVAAANAIVGGAAYTCNSTSTCTCDTGACSNAQLASFDLGQWYYRQDKQMPGALDAANSGLNCTNPNGIQSPRATIERVGNLATITICWFEQEQTGTTTLKSQTWQVEIY